MGNTIWDDMGKVWGMGLVPPLYGCPPPRLPGPPADGWGAGDRRAVGEHCGPHSAGSRWRWGWGRVLPGVRQGQNALRPRELTSVVPRTDGCRRGSWKEVGRRIGVAKKRWGFGDGRGGWKPRGLSSWLPSVSPHQSLEKMDIEQKMSIRILKWPLGAFLASSHRPVQPWIYLQPPQRLGPHKLDSCVYGKLHLGPRRESRKGVY